MIKKIQKPDGTVVEITGSPAEIAEYERAIRDGESPVQEKTKKKPEVIKGAPTDGFVGDELQKLLEDLIKKNPLPSYPELPVIPWQPYDFKPWIPVTYGHCHCAPCICNPFPEWPKTYCIKTIILTGNSTIVPGFSCSLPIDRVLDVGYRLSS